MPDIIDLLLGKGLGSIISLGVGGVSGYLVRKFKIQSPTKRLWQIKDGGNVIISISESTKSEVQIDNQVVWRSNTGMGQVKALGLVVESLSQAYSLSMKNIFFSEERLEALVEKDLIILGGQRNNHNAKSFFGRIKSLNIVEPDGNAFIWKKDGEPKRYVSVQGKDGERTEYGLIVRMPNPFVNSKNSTLCMFAGCHTIGTIASAKYFTEEYIKNYNVSNIMTGDKRTVFMIIEFKVGDAETYPRNISVIEKFEE